MCTSTLLMLLRIGPRRETHRYPSERREVADDPAEVVANAARLEAARSRAEADRANARLRSRQRAGLRLDEALDEVERGLGDLAPAVVDSEGMASVRDLRDLRHAGVGLLPLVGSVGDGPRHRVVLLALDDQQRTAVGVLGVHLRLGPRVEVRVAH